VPFTVRLFTDAVHSCPSLHRHITFLCVAAVIIDGLSGSFLGDHSFASSGNLKVEGYALVEIVLR